MCACNRTDSRDPAGGADSGFTLIETLVALVVFVACYLMVQQGIALGWRGVRLAQSDTAALQLAQARLASAGVEAPLTEGEQSGESPDGYDWTMNVRKREPDTSAGRPSFDSYWVSVEVRWRDRAALRNRSLQIKTIKLVARQ